MANQLIYANMDLDKLAHLAKIIARLVKADQLRAICLTGALGCGKTTFTRFLVEELPNAENAEISSPSFNICNFYPTVPQVAHADLYRCGSNLPEELLEIFDAKDWLLIIEWAEFLKISERPAEFLDICWQMCEKNRSLTLTAYGTQICSCLNLIKEQLAE